MPDSHRVYSYSAVLMGSPILLKLFSYDEALASRVFRLIKQYEDLLTVNRAHSDAPRDKCAHFREINGIAAAFQYLQ
ncbi:hypothetical protein CI630_20325, partial [Enterobacter hormaechei subsp. steigerwaltii]